MIQKSDEIQKQLIENDHQVGNKTTLINRAGIVAYPLWTETFPESLLCFVLNHCPEKFIRSFFLTFKAAIW